MNKDFSYRRDLYDKGLTDPEIAKMEGLTPDAIWAWRKKNGLPVNYKYKKNTQKDEVKETMVDYFPLVDVELIIKAIRGYGFNCSVSRFTSKLNEDVCLCHIWYEDFDRQFVARTVQDSVDKALDWIEKARRKKVEG